MTKSGTNNFHGSLYEYHRNTVTSANDYFVKLAELQSGEPNAATEADPQYFRWLSGRADQEGPVILLRQL